MHVGVTILRVSGGLDYSTVLGEAEGLQTFRSDSVGETPPGTPNSERYGEISESPVGETVTVEPKESKKSKKLPKKTLVYVKK